MRSMNKELIRQLEEFIDEYLSDNGVSPTILEIAEETGIPKTTVGRYLAYMKAHGIIDYEGHRNFATRQSRMTKLQSSMVPVLGSVSCGVPTFAEENIEEYVRLPVSIFGKGDFYMLRANGDSMIDAGIDDGDLILIKQQSTARPGQIVVALMEDEATLKRYYPEPEKRRVRLHPENERLKDIYVDSCIIQGVAVKVLKDLI